MTSALLGHNDIYSCLLRLVCLTDFMMDVISGQVPDRFRADHPEFTSDSLFGFWAQSNQVCTRSSVPSPCDLCVESFAVLSQPYIKLCVACRPINKRR